EDLALVRQRVSAAGFSAEILMVLQSGPDERMHRAVVFDLDALDAATTELDRLADARRPRALVVRNQTRGEAAMLAHDWDDYRDSMHPDVVYEDRRPGLHQVLGREEVVANS